MPGWTFTEGGGGAAGGSGDVTGPASATQDNLASFGDATGKVIEDSGVAKDDVVTAAAVGADNAAARFDGAAKAVQSSDLVIGDVSGGSLPVSTTPGNALALSATAPAATTGASQAGKAASLTASDAVASTDTAGAAAGGSVTITAGNAARNTSGNANGGNIVLVTGSGVGTGSAGNVTFPDGATNAPSIRFAGSVCGFYRNGNRVVVVTGSSDSLLLGNSFVTLKDSGSIFWSSTALPTGTEDTSLSRVAAGQVAVRNQTNGMANNIKIATTTVNASGATSTATNLVPAGCILLGVTTRVTTAITSGDGGTSVDIGNGTDADMYGNDVAFTLGTTTNLASHTASPLAWIGAAQSVVFTCNGGTFSGGVWRVVAHYLDLTAPTS